MTTESTGGRRTIVDVHTHIATEKLPLAAKVMEQVGLTAMVNLSGGFGEELKRSLAGAAKYPGRFVTFCRVDFTGIDDPDFGRKQAEELRRSAQAGARGLKVSKGLGLRARFAGTRFKDGRLVSVDDARLDPVWEAAGELGLPTLIHTADPPDFWLPVDENNPSYRTLKARPNWSYHGTDIPPHQELLYQRDRVVERHRRTIFIYAHMGDALEDLEYLACQLKENPHLYLDTSARCSRMGKEDPARMRDFFVTYQDRILFGTDVGANLGTEEDIPSLVDFYNRHWSFFGTAEKDLPVPFSGTARTAGIDLPIEVLEKLYWENARRLLELGSSGGGGS